MVTARVPPTATHLGPTLGEVAASAVATALAFALFFFFFFFSPVAVATPSLTSQLMAVVTSTGAHVEAVPVTTMASPRGECDVGRDVGWRART